MKDLFFIKELGFNQLNNKLPSEIEGKITGVDQIHYSGNLPAIFFKEVTNFEPKNLREISELQKQIWNNSSVVFLYVTSLAEIRIYNCNEKPVYSEDDYELQKNLEDKLIESCVKNDSEKLKQLKNVFSAIAIDCGSIWTSETGYAKKIKLQTKVDSYLVKSLISLAKKLNDDIEDEEVIHSLIMRSIFIMYLQDRDAIPQVIWDEVGNNDFLEILKDHNKTYKLFEIISGNFNGNAFPLIDGEQKAVTDKHLSYLKNCLTDGDINSNQEKLFTWRLFNFRLIRIEMLSEIYENFLGQFNPEKQRKTGTYYTPPSLVELVLNNVLPENELEYNKKILDPACGSGIFLAMAYKRIVNRWKKRNQKDPEFAILSKLLTDNIYGVELDKKSIKVAAFSLYLSMLDFLDPKDVWLDTDKCFPYLIYDEDPIHPDDKKGRNLYRTDAINENGKFENIEYDLVIGNPPFGTKGLEKNIREYCSTHSFDNQYVIPFIHKSASLAKNGEIALLFNTQLLTYPKTGIVNFRNWLFNNNHVEKVYNLSIFRNATKDFGGSLFSTAKVPVSIVFFQPGAQDKQEKTIEYWAPKTFVKNNVVEGVIIDKTDIKYLPRTECNKGDGYIWKIAQWGSLSDYFLIKKLQLNNPKLKDLEKNKEVIIKAGLHASEKGKEITRIRGKYLDTKNIQHYYTHDKFTEIIESEFREYDVNLFSPPYIGLPQNIMKRKVCASFFDKTIFFKSGIFLLKTKSKNQLKNFTILLNSKLSNYYFFLTSGCWGIERDQLFLTSEYKTFPVSKGFIDRENEIAFNDTNFDNTTLDFEDCTQVFDAHFFDGEIYSSYGLKEKEVAIIEDFMEYSISLFYDKETAIALRPIAPHAPETIPYAEILCNEMNDFLKIGDFKVTSRVYNVSPFTPLCMVVLQFVNKNEITNSILIESDIDFQKDLKKVNEFTLSKYAQNIYIRKQVRYSDKEIIYLVKPNQKRFWTRSQAIDDANTIINELSAFSDGE